MKTKLAIVALLATTTLNAGPWVSGVISGISTGVTVAMHVITAGGDYEDSKIDTSIERYQYETYVNYPLGPNTYYTKWLVWIDFNGLYHYEKHRVYDGVTLPIDYIAFEVGDYGLPLMKRSWNCAHHDATTWFTAWSTSSLKFAMKHTVMRYSTYGYAIPANYEAQVQTAGRVWEATCSPYPMGLYLTWNTTQSVPRNGKATFMYEGTNIQVEDIIGRVKQ
jgi:hypothetical protein